MRRLLVWMVAAVALTGCKGSRVASPLDPFSRTRIEPARTGWIMGQPAADPYYSGTRQATLPKSTSPTSGSGAAVPSSNPGTGTRYVPPGGHDYRGASVEKPRSPSFTAPGDRIAIPLAARNGPDPVHRFASRSGSDTPSGREKNDVNPLSTAAAATPSAVATAESLPSHPDRTGLEPAGFGAGGTPADEERIVRTINPLPDGSAKLPYRRSPAGPPSTEGEPRRLVLPERVINIMDLPKAGPASTSRSPAASGGVRLASATEEPDRKRADNTTIGGTIQPFTGGSKVESFSPRARFGYDPEYRWLKGRLEYSQSDRRWKLRYIPIDGATDDFGGSVVLSNTSLLSGYEGGQFVEVHGSLGRAAQDNDRSYAPEFKIERIERLGS